MVQESSWYRERRLLDPDFTLASPELAWSKQRGLPTGVPTALTISASPILAFSSKLRPWEYGEHSTPKSHHIHGRHGALGERTGSQWARGWGAAGHVCPWLGHLGPLLVDGQISGHGEAPERCRGGLYSKRRLFIFVKSGSTDTP